MKGSSSLRCNRGAALATALAAVSFTISCGSDSTAPSFPAQPPAATAIATGQRFGCVLTTDGKSYCWGDNLRGQLGGSSFVPTLVPTPTVGGHQFVAIAAGDQTACGLDRSGIVWCWGDDPTQPNVAVSYATVPVRVSAPRTFKAITVGRKFGCGLDVGGAAYCWGQNEHGQAGAGDTVPKPGAVAVKTDLRFTSIAADFFGACALTSAGAAWCWGDNAFGELGATNLTISATPVAVSGTQTFRQLSSGPIHQCGLTASGAAFCWGSNLSGQLGDGTTTTRAEPTPVGGGLTFSSLRSSRVNSTFSTTCGIVTSGDVYCWGYDSRGQLGTGATASSACMSSSAQTGTTPVPLSFVCSYTPTKVVGLSNVVSLDVGLEHECALTTAAQVLCWGDGTHGELGDGNGVASATPVQIKGGLPLP